MPPMPVPSICYRGIPVSVMSDAKGCYTPIGDTGMPFYGYQKEGQVRMCHECH